jgi:hypothetical protein
MPAMTQDEFVEYAHNALDADVLEGLYETISEHNGEVARFGDSWPGALVQIHESIADVYKLERQLARIEKREPRDFRFRVSCPR